MSEELKEVRAPRSLEHNGNSYYRIGGLHISPFTGAIFYSAEKNSTVKMNVDGTIEETDFQSMFKNKLFNPLNETRVFYTNGVSYGTVIMPIVIRRMSFLKLNSKHIMKNVKGKRHTVISFRTAEDLTQFKFYFSDFFVEQ
jgi:hypothetical protein